MSADLSCPVCGTELDLAALFAHETDQRALARLAAVSIPLGARVLQYVALFTPPKQRLTAAKKIKLLLQLLPDLERCAITHKFDRAGINVAEVLEADALDAIRARLISMPRGGRVSDAVSVCYPLVVNNLVCRALNAAAAVGFPKVDAQVIAGC